MSAELSPAEHFKIERAKRIAREASDEQIAEARALFDAEQDGKVSAKYRKLRAERKEQKETAVNKGAEASRRGSSLSTGQSIYAKAQETAKARKAAS